MINAKLSPHLTLNRTEKLPSLLPESQVLHARCRDFHSLRWTQNHIGRLTSSANEGTVVRIVSLKHWVNLGSVVSHVIVSFQRGSGQNAVAMAGSILKNMDSIENMLNTVY